APAGAPIPGISKGCKQLTNTAPCRPQMQSFISAQVAALAGTGASQSAARDALIAEASDGAQPASPAYLDTYAELLNPAVGKLASNPQMRVRLNAAIVTARVAERADNSRLADAAVAFINDKSEPVALWGLKAARALIPAVLRDPLLAPNNKLVPAAADVVK